MRASATLAALLALTACNTDPSDQVTQTVGYRDGLAPDEPNSGERGSVVVSEILWSGSVTDDGKWDPSDVFIEVRNQGNRPMNVSGWRLELEGASMQTYIIPNSELNVEVGGHRYLAAKTTGCFPEPDWVVPDLELPYGDPIRVTLRDADERLMEPAGSRDMPPFAGGYDTQVSRSMEKIELMFGGRGSEPHSWHFYSKAEVDVPNDDRIAEGCRERTHASPGRPNSPDYSGAYASGAFE